MAIAQTNLAEGSIPKKLARFVRPILVGVVLIAAFCYLVYTLLQPAQPTGTPVLYDAIGTVEIHQDGQT